MEIIAKIPHWWFFKVICVYQVCLLRCWMNLFFFDWNCSWRKCILFLARNQSFRFIMVYGIMGPWDPEFSQSVCTQKWDGLFSWKRNPLLWTLLTPMKMNIVAHTFPGGERGSDPFSTFLFMGRWWLVPVNFSHIHLPGVKTSFLPCDVRFSGSLEKPIIPRPAGSWAFRGARCMHCQKQLWGVCPFTTSFQLRCRRFFFGRRFFWGCVFFYF